MATLSRKLSLKMKQKLSDSVGSETQRLRNTDSSTPGQNDKDTSETPGQNDKDTSETPGQNDKDTSETPGQNDKDTSETPGQNDKDTASTSRLSNIRLTDSFTEDETCQNNNPVHSPFTEEICRFVRQLAEHTEKGKPPTAAKFKMLSVRTLQQLLHFNNRPHYRLTKPELAACIADYMKNGCPPRCPKCLHGALKFSNGKKRFGKRYYWCPGSTQDGRHFLGCSFKAPASDIKRVPWKCP